MQLRILHWQTSSHAEHESFGFAYSKLDDLIDNLVEVYQGKYKRLSFTANQLKISNYDEIDIKAVILDVTDFLTTRFNEVVNTNLDTDCLNIRDEILSILNKLSYLLTLK